MRLSSLVFLCFFVVACGTASELGIQGESGSNVTEVEAVSADTPSSDEWEAGDDDADDGADADATDNDDHRAPCTTLGRRSARAATSRTASDRRLSTGDAPTPPLHH